MIPLNPSFATVFRPWYQWTKFLFVSAHVKISGKGSTPKRYALNAGLLSAVANYLCLGSSVRHRLPMLSPLRSSSISFLRPIKCDY